MLYYTVYIDSTGAVCILTLMERCPKCQSKRLWRNGIVAGRQRYVCLECGFHPSVVHRANTLSPDSRRIASEMRREGLSYRLIGRVLRVTHTSILRMLRQHQARSSVACAVAAQREPTAEVAPADPPPSG